MDLGNMNLKDKKEEIRSISESVSKSDDSPTQQEIQEQNVEKPEEIKYINHINNINNSTSYPPENQISQYLIPYQNSKPYQNL